MNKFLLLACLPILLAGCQTNQGGGTGLAAVEITGRNIHDVVDATRTVMRSNNYTEAAAKDGRLVFEKPASARDTAAFGSLMHDAVWERVKILVTKKPSGSVLIDCEVFMVEDKDKGMFEEERRIGVMRRARYQSLLGEIKAKLNPPAPAK